MLKTVFTFSLLLQAVWAFSQGAITVNLPASGDYQVFTSKGIPLEVPGNPTASKGGPTSVTPSGTDDTVSVWDKKSGNLGSKPIAKVKAGWTVAASDLDHIGQVEIHVEHDELPVAAGDLQLADGMNRQSEILDSKSNGTVTFFDVKPGSFNATARVKSSTGKIETVTMVFKSELARDKPVPTFTIGIAAPVDTVAATPSSAKSPGSTGGTNSNQPKSENPSPVGQVLTYVVALAIAAGLLYGAVHYFKKTPGTVSEKLEQLGVQIPKPDDQMSVGGPPAPISIPKPEPPQKIILDDAAPMVVASVPSAASTMVAQEPSLVNVDGIAIPLFEGETVVGRDPGLGLSLTGETTVSRKHATVVRAGSQVTVTDAGSTNGTFVNGARLQSPVILRNGDSVQFGSVAFRYAG